MHFLLKEITKFCIIVTVIYIQQVIKIYKKFYWDHNHSVIGSLNFITFIYNAQRNINQFKRHNNNN